jgi:hypothetical protein
MQINPTSSTGWNRLAKRQIDQLKIKNEQLRDQVAYLTDQLFKPGIPGYVRAWMREYDSCWEVFFCSVHDEWYTELDSLFPFHHENCHCPKCE